MYMLFKNTLEFLDEHKKAKAICGLLLVVACMYSAFEFGTNIGEFVFVLTH